MITKHIKDYCCEDISHIENYAQAVADQEQVWNCHHRRETIYTREGLKEIGEYYHRPAAELIFLPHEKHISLHKAGARNHMYGKHHSKAAKEKISTSSKGKTLSAETKAKLSASVKATMSKPEVRAKLSAAKKGKPSPRKGAHLSAATKQKLREANIGKKHDCRVKEKIKKALKEYWSRKKKDG